MKIPALFVLMALLLVTGRAQPSFKGPMPDATVVGDASLRRAAYLARVQEAISWRAGLAKPGELATLGLPEIVSKLALREEEDEYE
jgi:hypothetical protein